MRPAVLRALPLAAAVTLALAATGHAATFTPADGDALQAAFTQAQANGQDDTITLAAGTLYTRGTGAEFSFSSSEAKTLTLVGNGATVNAPSVSGFPVISLSGGTIDVSHLDVLMEAAASSGLSLAGADTVGTVDDVDVSGTTTDVSGRAILLEGTTTATNVVSTATVSNGITLSGTDVTLEGADVSGATGRQIEIGGGTASITDVTLHDPGSPSAAGIETNDSAAVVTARRARISGSSPAASALFGSTMTITDSLLRLTGDFATGLAVSDLGNPAPLGSTLTAERVTIAGTGATGQTAAIVGGGTASEQDTMTINVRTSIVTGVPFTFSCGEGNTQSTNAITVVATAVPEAAVDDNGCADPPSDAGITYGKGFTTVAPVFADAAAGDYRQRYDSPLVDRGPTVDPLVGSDLAGGLRFVNGILDLGAYEYQGVAPEVTVSGTPGAPTAGQPVQLTATATDADPGETAELTYAWTFSDGGSATGAMPLHVFPAIGAASATVTVTDPTGQATQRTVQLNVVAPPAGSTDRPAAPGPAAPEAIDTTVPKLTGLLVAKTIRLGSSLPGAVTRGGQLRFTLSEAATVRVRFERARGRRYVRVPGTITLKLGAGRRAVRFTGRLSRTRALKRGAYRVVLTATDATGNVGDDARATFTLR